MMEIINFYKNNPPSKDFEKHHIIPRCYFKKNNMPVDNTKNNVVRLPYFKHLIVHYYASFCCPKEYEYSMWNACHRLSNNTKRQLAITLLMGEENYTRIKQIIYDKRTRCKCKKVYCYETEKWYNSASAAARELNLKSESVTKVCKGLFRQTKGYHFSYDKSIPLVVKERKVYVKRGKYTRRVKCVNDGKVFNSVRECALFYNLTEKNIINRCKNYNKVLHPAGRPPKTNLSFKYLGVR